MAVERLSAAKFPVRAQCTSDVGAIRVPKLRLGWVGLASGVIIARTHVPRYDGRVPCHDMTSQPRLERPKEGRRKAGQPLSSELASRARFMGAL